MPSPTFTNDYAPDGKAIREAARVAAGHRCIRCGHPYECGKKYPEAGKWSPCDEHCTHMGPIRIWNSYDDSPSLGHWVESTAVADTGFLVQGKACVEARWRILTVHHFDGDKANDVWWNHLALCQVCHLSFQTRVNPEIPWLFEHSDWLKPYVAGFYAKKYRGLDLTREQVMDNLAELLFLEQRTS